MAGLKIQVNGRGLIPRGYGLAPRKDPFMANDINLIGLILNTSGLSVKYVNPSNGRLEDLSKKNLKKVWDQYSNYTAPATPDQGEDKDKTEEVRKAVASQKKAKEPVPKIEDIPVKPSVTPAADATTDETAPAEVAPEAATPAEEKEPEQQPTESKEAPQGQGNPNNGKVPYNNNKSNKNR